MRNFRKFISSSLATLLIVGAMSGALQAKTYEDVTPADTFADQIGILSDIGVIKGTSDTEFSPDDPVTREQMALFLFRLMIGKDTAGTLNTSPFIDLSNDTYHGAISWANASGYILGTGESTFSPREGITMQDAMTMLVRALGHGSHQMNSGYPWTFIDTAVKLGLDDNLEDVGYTKQLTRSEVAGLLYNALTAEYLIPRTASNGMTFYESTTIIEQVFGYDISESVIVATNKFAIDGLETVTKNGYVTVRTDEGLMTVKYSELGLEGTAEENLGINLRLVYKTDDKTRLVSVLGATELGKVEKPETITFGKDNSNVEIGGVKYQVVETLSDSLSTNANELLVYSYDADGVLTQITSNADLAALTGAFDARLIFDSRDSDTANRLIIKSYSFGQYKVIGGKVNIAGEMKESELKLVAPDSLKSDDYVLYYFNDEHDTLEVAAILPVGESGKVSRLTSTSATVGGVKYDLGNEKLGVSAASIRERLNVGEHVRVVTLNGAIIAIDSSSVSNSAASKYLLAESTVTPVFAGGKLGYVLEANVNGVSKSIFVTNSSVEEGMVYRYTTDANDVYTLIPASISGGVIGTGLNQFVQSGGWNDELAFIIDSADETVITTEDAHFVLSQGNADAATSTDGSETEIGFITDENSFIIVKNGEDFEIVRGNLTAQITINNGANVTAVFDNEVGSIETLRYLYISDGELGRVNSTASSVKVLANVGSELVNGQVYSLYKVLDLSTGKLETMMSPSDALEAGVNYLLRVDGYISDSEASIAGGEVSGYTASTITVGSTTYTLAADVVVVALNTDDTVESIKVADTYEENVDIIIEDGKVKTVVLIREAVEE